MADKKTKTHMGYEVENCCPCGETVAIYERQELIFNPNTNKWNRICFKCINANRSFAIKSSSLAGVV